MIDVASRKNQNIAVLGLGVSGMASARALERSGATVTVWDDNADRRDEARDAGLHLSNPASTDFGKLDALLLAPGIPFAVKPHPAVTAARTAGRPVIGDIELLAENSAKARLIGITGTNGKSTTTALIAHLLTEAGLPCQAGGNLGPPVLEFDPPCDGETLVLELSSFQLDLIEQAPFDIAVLINISPDHLDRHGTMDAYIAAKKRLFRHPRRPGSSIAIIGIDDPHAAAVLADMSKDERWQVVPVSTTRETDGGVFVRNGVLFDARSGAARRICDLSGIPTLRGRHNHQNAACAYIAAICAGATENSIVSALKTFPGLPHRMEVVGQIGPIQFVNDSKATNVDAAITALASFEDVFWIAGGRGKGEDYAPLAAHAGHIKHAFLIGEAARDIASTLPADLPVTISETLDLAARQALAAARTDGGPATILLSPACASFDQFANFATRGDAFRTLAGKLAAEASS